MNAPARVNWGRSFTSPSPNAENQLVRVQLPHSHDLTLYLQPMRDRNGLPATVVDYHVTVGTGGIAVLSGAWVPVPLVGVARHYVADTIEVSVITPGASPPNPRIVAANVAIGRPSDVFEPGGRVGTIAGTSVPTATMPGLLTNRADNHSWQQVDPGLNQLFRIPPFATHLQIRTRAKTAGIIDGDMLVWGITPSGSASVQPTSVLDYATPQPLPPDIVLIEVDNANAGPLEHFDVLLTFTCSL